MTGHAACNITPVMAANRIGTEIVTPCEANSNQASFLTFYGSSFITDETGDIIAEASRDNEEIIFSEINIDAVRSLRQSWGLFRDRRPSTYSSIINH